MDPRVVKESLVRTRSERVLDRYIRDVEPKPAKKPKVEEPRSKGVTPLEAFRKLKTHLADPKKFAKSVSLLWRLLEASSEEIPLPEQVEAVQAIVRHPLVHAQARTESAKVIAAVQSKATQTLEPRDLQLWTLVAKVNQLVTDDSLVFSARMKDFLQEVEAAKRESREEVWWTTVVKGLKAVSEDLLSAWARVPLSSAVDFCVRNLSLFSEADQTQITDLATALQRERLRQGKERGEQIRGPMESGHRVADGREEVSVINGADAWSTRQSGLSQ